MAAWVFGQTETTTASCHCCGREMHRLAGTVWEPGGDAQAAFFVALVTPGHPSPRVKLALVVGDLSEGSHRSDRRVVAMEIWRRGDDYVTGLIDADDAMSSDDQAGLPMSAADVRASPSKERIFSISDAIVREHDSLREHLDRSFDEPAAPD